MQHRAQAQFDTDPREVQSTQLPQAGGRPLYIPSGLLFGVSFTPSGDPVAGTAALQSTLNAVHLDAIAHWKAHGLAVSAIVVKLSEGEYFGDEQPTPVDVSESAVRYRLGTSDVQRRIFFWRSKLFGTMTSPLAFAAQRMERLDAIYASAYKDLEAAQKPAARSAARKDLLAVVAAAQRIAERSQAEVTIRKQGEGGQLAEAKLSAESLDLLAEKLESLQRAGLLPDSQSELEGENAPIEVGPLADPDEAESLQP